MTIITLHHLFWGHCMDSSVFVLGLSIFPRKLTLPRKNTSTQNKHLRIHTMTSKQMVRSYYCLNMYARKNNMNYWLICMPGPTPHLLKRWNLALQPELDEHTFFFFFLISTKKESKYTAISMHIPLFVSLSTVSSNARLNPNLNMTLDNSHNASLILK